MEVLIATIDRVDVTQGRFPFRRKHPDKENGRGAKRRWRFDICTVQRRRPFDVHAMRIGEQDIGAKFFISI